MCFLFISEQAATFALYAVNWFFYNTGGKYLLRGTTWIFK
jgi:hypothetical protein